MKKNRMMRLASSLLVAVLLTTSVISGTFAKYTTSASSEDKARVAYWGFQSTNSMEFKNLFSDTYTNVDSINNADIIAPGTSGKVTFVFAWDETVTAYDENVNVTGPEVAYDFTVSVDGSYCDELIAKNPNIKWRLDGKDDDGWTDWGTFLNQIKALSGDADGTETYSPGDLPIAFTKDDDVHVIEWMWDFSTTAAQDAADTAMGNAENLDDVKLIITINATQID